MFSDESNLFIMDADGSNLRQVPLPEAGQGRRLEKPAWSPDGGLIFFSWQETGSTTPDLEIFAIQPDGSGLRQLTDAAGNSVDPALSPDGKKKPSSCPIATAPASSTLWISMAGISGH